MILSYVDIFQPSEYATYDTTDCIKNMRNTVHRHLYGFLLSQKTDHTNGGDNTPKVEPG